MKPLCLVLDSDPIEPWRETYDSHRSLWRRCLDSYSHMVDGIFVRSDPILDVESKMDGRVFTVRGHEEFGTVLHKVVSAIDALLTDEHSYVIQTGLSSLYNFDLLLSGSIRTGVYAGHPIDGYYVSGAGILMSNDVARLLVSGREHANSGWQDIAIQQILHAQGVEPQFENMFEFDYSKDFSQQLDRISDRRHLCYRFHHCTNPDRTHERVMMAAAFERLYG